MKFVEQRFAYAIGKLIDCFEKKDGVVIILQNLDGDNEGIFTRSVPTEVVKDNLMKYIVIKQRLGDSRWINRYREDQYKIYDYPPVDI